MIKMLDVMSYAEIFELLHDINIETRSLLDEALTRFKAENQAKISESKL